MKTTIGRRSAKFLKLFITLLIFSCKKEEATPTETCKVSVIDRGNGNKHNYTYDTNGRVATMTREFDGSGSGNILKFVYSFTYDNAGLLVKAVSILDGKPDGTETYTYTNGKISKGSFVGADGSKSTSDIKYDASGRILDVSYKFDDPTYDQIQYFEYNSDGVMVKHGYKALDGTVFFQLIIKPVGFAKSPEQLLSKYGLPYDVLTGYAWASS